MKFIWSLGLLMTTGLSTVVTVATDYCTLNVCRPNRTHIACNNTGAFGTDCPTDARVIDLTTHIGTILDFHNINRNEIAGGELTHFKSAKRMATIQWDKELAALAVLNVKQCKMWHDKCRNTNAFHLVGQNVASFMYSGNETLRDHTYLLYNRMESWWREHENAKMEILEKYPAGYKGPSIGHFVLLITDKNVRMGCGAARYTQKKLNTFLICCNYATTNIVGEPIYEVGPAASGCKKGPNPKYPYLCAPGEHYTGLK